MAAWERMVEEERQNLLFLLGEDFSKESFVVQNNISEALGLNKSMELDPATGAITLLDSERGVTLSAVEALLLRGFINQHEDLIGLSAFIEIEAVEAVIGE